MPAEIFEGGLETERKLLTNNEEAGTNQGEPVDEQVNPQAREKSAILDMYDSDLSDEKIAWAKDQDKGKPSDDEVPDLNKNDSTKTKSPVQVSA